MEEAVRAGIGIDLGTSAAEVAPTPIWPELDSSQKAEALAASWPRRLRHAMAGAAVLALLTGLASFRAADGAFDWRVGISLTLAGSFLASFFLLKSHGLSRSWLAPLGLITIALTLINLMACMMEQVRGSINHEQAAADPAFIFLTLIVGSLWALRIHLSPTGFALGAVVTTGILWAPWVALSEAPFEFALTGLACLAVGAQMRWINAERAYATFRREIVWPRLWRGSVQAAVLRELSRRSSNADDAPVPANPRMEQLAAAVDAAGMQTSLVGLTAALGSSEAPSQSADQSEHAPKKADSPE